MTYYNWKRERKCSTCGEPFATMGGNLTDCAVCRHTPEAEAKRQERKKRLKARWDKRKASIRRREHADATRGLQCAANIVPQHAEGGMLRDGEAAA